MKIVLRVAVGLLAVVLLVLIIGALLPGSHTAAVEGRYRAAAEDVYAMISDVEGGVRWRSGLQRVDVLSDAGGELRWRETADWGTLTFVREVDDPPRRLANRIVDEGQGFGGTWTWEIVPSADGTVVRITEQGDVSNPIFRFMSRFVFGYYTGIETYLRDLGRVLGDDVTPVRLD